MIENLEQLDAYINVRDELNAVQKAFDVRANGNIHFRFNIRSYGHGIDNFYDYYYKNKK